MLLYPLWLGTMPALVKGFLEQVLRPDFAFKIDASGRHWKKHLRGKSARIVITMGMPAPVYRWYFRAHGLKNLERNVLGFCGIKPIKASLIGMVEENNSNRHQLWLNRMRKYGSKGI